MRTFQFPTPRSVSLRRVRVSDENYDIKAEDVDLEEDIDDAAVAEEADEEEDNVGDGSNVTDHRVLSTTTTTTTYC